MSTVFVDKAVQASRSIFLACGIVYSSLAPMFPHLKQTLKMSESTLGFVLLSYGCGALLAMPLIGLVIDRFGSRLLSRIFLPLFIIGMPLTLLSQSAVMFGGVLFFMGCMSGCLNISMNNHVAQLCLISRRRLMSGCHCWFSVGGLTGSSLMALLMTFNLSILQSALCIAIGLLVLAVPKLSDMLKKEQEGQTRSSSSSGTFTPKLVIAGIFCFILYLAEGSMLDWSAILLKSTYNYSIAYSGVGFALFSIAMATGRYFGDHLISRFGEAKMITLGAFLAAVGIVLIVMPYGHYKELLGFLLTGIGSANIVPIVFAKAAEISGNVGLTFVTTLGYAGMILGPAFIGFIAEVTTLPISLSIIGILLVAVGICSPLISSKPDLTVPSLHH